MDNYNYQQAKNMILNDKHPVLMWIAFTLVVGFVSGLLGAIPVLGKVIALGGTMLILPAMFISFDIGYVQGERVTFVELASRSVNFWVDNFLFIIKNGVFLYLKMFGCMLLMILIVMFGILGAYYSGSFAVLLISIIALFPISILVISAGIQFNYFCITAYYGRTYHNIDKSEIRGFSTKLCLWSLVPLVGPVMTWCKNICYILKLVFDVLDNEQVAGSNGGYNGGNYNNNNYNNGYNDNYNNNYDNGYDDRYDNQYGNQYDNGYNDPYDDRYNNNGRY